MIRNRWILVLALVTVCAALSFGAEAKPAAPAKTAPKETTGSFLGGRDLGLIVNLVDPFILAGAGDSVQTGLGMKLWLNDRSVVRGLVSFTLAVDTVADTTDMGFGLSAAYEHHFAQRQRFHRTWGASSGRRWGSESVPHLSVYLGGLLGAEVEDHRVGGILRRVRPDLPHGGPELLHRPRHREQRAAGDHHLPAVGGRTLAGR